LAPAAVVPAVLPSAYRGALGLAGALDADEGIGAGSAGPVAAVVPTGEPLAGREGAGTVDAGVAAGTLPTVSSAAVVSTLRFSTLGDAEALPLVTDLLFARTGPAGSATSVRPARSSFAGLEGALSGDAILPAAALPTQAPAAVGSAGLPFAEWLANAAPVDALVVQVIAGTAGTTTSIGPAGLPGAVRDAGADAANASFAGLLAGSTQPLAAIAAACLPVTGMEDANALITGLPAVAAATGPSAAIIPALHAEAAGAAAPAPVVLSWGLPRTIGTTPNTAVGRAGRFADADGGAALSRFLTEGVTLPTGPSASVVATVLVLTVRDAGTGEGPPGAVGLVDARHNDEG
jgi:hypothetical protein